MQDENQIACSASSALSLRVHSLGRVKDYTPEQLRRIGIRLYELGGDDIKAFLEGTTEEID
jgi:hypothetical protein